MKLLPRGHAYPEYGVRVSAWPASFADVFPTPLAPASLEWPPTQVTYLGKYLEGLRCKTVVLESHYVDRDYIHDMALYYARSLRSPANYCQRLHFFTNAFDEAIWQQWVKEANAGKRDEVAHLLQEQYVGFCVVRPLPGSPIGRTVLPTLGPKTSDGHERNFTAVRKYRVNLAGFELQVVGLAFQQQDQAVSTCATTALWSALQYIAPLEDLPVPAPAEITESASRYYLGEIGRWLPSEGLSISHVCEATRALGLSPLVIRGVSPEHDRAQLLGYVRSGFAPVLAIMSAAPGGGGEGHAVCTVGLKLGQTQPQSVHTLHFRDAATAVLGLYIHDDRLGPYASATIVSRTVGRPPDSRVRTGLDIRWPDGTPDPAAWYVHAMVVPVPLKLRLTIGRMRQLGLFVADAAGALFPQFNRTVILNSQYRRVTEYRAAAYGYGLSDGGAYALMCETVLSRYVGVVEIGSPGGPLFDVLFDTTETAASLAVRACVRREGLPNGSEKQLQAIARWLRAAAIL